jgi:hypothetical protein
MRGAANKQLPASKNPAISFFFISVPPYAATRRQEPCQTAKRGNSMVFRLTALAKN